MSNLSQAQRDLLVQIAETEGGAINAPAEAKPTVAALIRRGLIISVPREDQASQLLITTQGREAMTPDAKPAGDQPAIAANASTPSEAAAAPQAPGPKGKLGAVVGLLRRPGGARLDELMTATGWQAHSVRGAGRSGEEEAGSGRRLGKDRRGSDLSRADRDRRVTPDKITEELRALERLDLEGLRALWRGRWGAPPSFRSPELLRRMIAWRIQVAAFGDLDAEARRSLRRPAPMIRSGIALTRGTKLTREWRGARCEVEVVDGGYLYAGVTYKSLSKIAGVITGTKWNGPRFFGLDKAGTS